jgi:phosphoserine aminotransferase
MFSALPMNLLRGKKTANYLTTGAWSKGAWAEVNRECKANEVWPTSKGVFNRMPNEDEMKIDPEGAYFHFCGNETIHGVKATDFPFHKIPKGMPVVCDMSSCICSEPIDWTKFDVVYAGAQKNVGPSGITILIIKEELIGHARPGTPIMLDFKTHQKGPQTYHNTPNTWGIYVSGLNFAHMKAEGIDMIKARNERKAKILYDAIANSGGYYSSPVEAKYRSLMNVPFRVCKDAKLEAKFIAEGTMAGLREMPGHRSVGGVRASIYNAMPDEGVCALVNFMRKFQQENPAPAKL